LFYSHGDDRALKASDNVLKFLEESTIPRSVVIVGLGNLDRADDGLGIILAERLKDRYPGHVFSEKEKSVEGMVLELLERKDIRVFLFVDAMDFGGEPGEVRLFSAEDAERFVPSFSTHKVPIALLMGMIQERGKRPFLLGVQPGSLEFLGKMSLFVQNVLDRLEKDLTVLLSRGIKKF